MFPSTLSSKVKKLATKHKKNKLNYTAENEIPMIVHAHNHMNKILGRIYCNRNLNNCKGGDNDDNKKKSPKLSKCQCRPMDSLPKVSFKNCALGHPLTFDHYDWHVETTTELKRHDVDYYYQDESSSTSKNESDEDKNTLIDMTLALDSF